MAAWGTLSDIIRQSTCQGYLSPTFMCCSKMQKSLYLLGDPCLNTRNTGTGKGGQKHCKEHVPLDGGTWGILVALGHLSLLPFREHVGPHISPGSTHSLGRRSLKSCEQCEKMKMRLSMNT